MYEEDNIEPEFLKRAKAKPFRTPDHYFDSIEDRVMGTIEFEAKKKTTSGPGKVFQLLKPVLGLAASFALIFTLAYFPIKYFSPKNMAKTEIADSSSQEEMDGYSFNFSLIDESSLANVLFGDDASTPEEMNPDEVLAYLSTEMTDIEIYTEIQN